MYQTMFNRPAHLWTRRLAQLATMTLYAIAIGSIAIQVLM